MTYIITWKASDGTKEQVTMYCEIAADNFMEALKARGIFPFIAAVKVRRAA